MRSLVGGGRWWTVVRVGGARTVLLLLIQVMQWEGAHHSLGVRTICQQMTHSVYYSLSGRS